MMRKPGMKNLSVAFTFTLCGLGAISVRTADAQTSLSPQMTPHNQPSYCKNKPPQAEKFMTAISTIIGHGDLTDIQFVEKTFQTKFKEEPAKTFNDQPDPERIFFQTNQVFGSAIYVDLSLSRSKNNPPKNQFVAYMVIYDQHSAGLNTTYIEDCIDVSARTFSSHFGGDFVPVYANDLFSPYGTQHRQQDFPGKNNTMLQLSISTDYMRPDNPVVAVGIYEIPKSAGSGN